VLSEDSLKTIGLFLDSIDTIHALSFAEQTSVLVYGATCLAGELSVTGPGLDKLRAALKLAPCNSSKYLSMGSQGRSRRFLKRPRGYVLLRAEEERVAAMGTSAPATVATRTTPRAVVLTALSLEFNAVTRRLSSISEVVHPAGTIYSRGLLRGMAGEWEVFVVEVGPGNAPAAVEAERAINHFAPDVALFVGVAGGIKDVSLGDVVVATKVYGYESGKAKAQRFLPRPDVARTSYRLEQRARAEARRPSWSQALNSEMRPNGAPRVLVGPIAAGEKVVSSSRSHVATFLQEWYSDALAVEMEGRGFLEASHSNSLDAAVIRGISDLLTGKSTADRQGWQMRAADSAAAFAMHLVSEFIPPGAIGLRQNANGLTTSGKERHG
jgi:nucleoside phosphorylase